MQRTRLILKFSFIVSIPIYMFVGYNASKNSTDPPQDVHIMTIILAVVYIVSLLVSLIIQRMRPQANPMAGFVNTMAVRLSGAVYGLILTFLTHDPMYTVYFGVPAILLLLIA